MELSPWREEERWEKTGLRTLRNVKKTNVRKQTTKENFCSTNKSRNHLKVQNNGFISKNKTRNYI